MNSLFPSHRIIHAIAFALVVALALPAQASDAARIKELEKKLGRSLEMIEQLSSKINKLEQASSTALDSQSKAAQQAAQASATALEAQSKTVQQVAKIASIEKSISEIGGSLSRRSQEGGLPVHGFADVGVVKNNENNVTGKGNKGATVGSFDLYLTPQFSDRVKALVELVFETEAGGGIATDLERAQIGYTFSDAATAWLGRFHTPYGYWNTAYHHGAQIQTSILRPIFLDFEDAGGILPAHTTGLWLTGAMGTANGRFGYDAYLANAPQILGTATASALSGANPAGFSTAVNRGTYAGTGTLDMRQSGSTTHRNSVGFNTWFEPQVVDGLRLGIHGLRAEVADDSADANQTRLNMLGGYFAYLGEPWEALGEYYRFRNQDRSGGTGTHLSWAGYMQIGYSVGKWMPFARVERTKLDQTDNYFAVQASGRSYKRGAIGLRYEVDPKAAFKFEYAHTRKENLGPGGDDKYPELRIQYAIRF